MKYQAEERASEYRSKRHGSAASNQGAFKAPAVVTHLPAHREMNNDKVNPDRSKGQAFKINKRPQSANIKPSRQTDQSYEQIAVIESNPKRQSKKVSGAQADENLLFKSKMYVSLMSGLLRASHSRWQ